MFLFFKKDNHPEPRYLIIRTFLLGIIIAPLVVIFEYLAEQFSKIFAPGYISDITAFFILAALIEEYMKYFVVKVSLLHNPDFDEPVDAMIYMIAAGLGFAAIENILVLFKVVPGGFLQTTGVWILRFGGATLLHALSSAIVGYFLGIAWFYRQHAKKVIALGLFIATLFHLAFNLIIYSQVDGSFLRSAFLLLFMFIVVSFLFIRLKKRQDSVRSVQIVSEG